MQTQINFDVQMLDHNEFEDSTVIGVSRSDNDAPIALAILSFNAENEMMVKLAAPEVFKNPEAFSKEIIAAVNAELSVHPDAETLRDLFADVVPSGSVSAEYL